MWQVKLLGVAGVLALAAWGGWEWRDRAADLTVAQMEKDYLLAQSEALTNAMEAQSEAHARAKDQARQREQMRALQSEFDSKLQQEIGRYEETLTDIERECSLTARWVLQADKAQRGPPAAGTRGTGEPDDSAAAITCVRALRVVTQSASVYYDTADKLTRLQALVRDYEASLAEFRRENGP